MAQINVSINGRQFRMVCEDGQEEHHDGCYQCLPRGGHKACSHVTFPFAGDHGNNRGGLAALGLRPSPGRHTRRTTPPSFG